MSLSYYQGRSFLVYRTARCAVFALAAVALLQTYCYSQVTLPPIIGDSLWTKRLLSNQDRPPHDAPGFYAWNALAEDAGLVFRVIASGIMVIKADNGEIVERINLGPIVQNYRSTLRVYCDRAGSKLLVFYGGTDSLRSVLLSYPEKKVLKVFTYEDPVDSWYFNHCAVSPDGRWIIVPKGWNTGQRYILYDALRDTVLYPPQFQKLLSWSSWSFDGKSQQLAYGQYNYDTTSTLMIFDLTSPDLRTRTYPNTACFINPKFSADGKYVIATSTRWGDGLHLGSWPMVSVLECSTGKVIWHVAGNREWWGQVDVRHDLFNYAISGDGRFVYAYRKDTIADVVVDEGFFYRLPDVVPVARAIPGTVGGCAPDHRLTLHCGYTSFSSDLRRAYAESNDGNGIKAYNREMVAMQFDVLPTSVAGNAEATETSNVLYPNPTTGALTLTWSGPDPTVYWQLLDIGGSLLHYSSSPVLQGKASIEIPQSIAPGRYTLLVRDFTARTVEHLVVIKN